LIEKILACTDCRKKFETLHALNTHIGRTKHHNGKKITKYKILLICGIVPNYQTVDLKQTTLAI